MTGRQIKMKTEDLLFNEKFNSCYGSWTENTRQRFADVLEKVEAICDPYDAWFAETTKDLRCGFKEDAGKGKNLFMFFFSQSNFGMWISRHGILADDGGPFLKPGDERYHELRNLHSDEQLNFAMSHLEKKVAAARSKGILPSGRNGHLPDFYSPEDKNMNLRQKLIKEFTGQEKQLFSRKDIVRRMKEKHGVNADTLKDYCYNSCNKSHNFNKNKLAFQALFEFIDEGYRYLGPGADYSGVIIWNPKEKERTPMQIGRWQDGEIVEWHQDVADEANSETQSATHLAIAATQELPMLATNRIYFGPPGTGKTHILQTEVLVKYQDETDEPPRYRFVTFHPSYSYEEFVEGIRAETNDDGQIRYQVKGGIFRQLCNQAEADPDQRYALIVDEINRGNIAKIFGELITLIEPDKRQGAEHGLQITLPYSGETFGVPSNLDIYGTMNTADRSLALMDTALRRRFDFKEMLADPCLLSHCGKDGVTQQYRNQVAQAPLSEHADDLLVFGINLRLLLTVMNLRIERLYDREHTLGHAFLLPVKKALQLGEEAGFNALQHAFENKIIPLLEEYFFEDWCKIRQVLGDDQKGAAEDQFIHTEDEAKLPSYQVLFGGDAPARRLPSYQKNAIALTRVTAFKGIFSTACQKNQVAVA